MRRPVFPVSDSSVSTSWRTVRPVRRRSRLHCGHQAWSRTQAVRDPPCQPRSMWPRTSDCLPRTANGTSWIPGPALTAIGSVPSILETGDAFRPLFLREMSRRAVELAAGQESPSDLSLALTWALGRDPLMPLPWDWREAEYMLKAEGMSEIIDNSSQWNPFRRWLTALGLGAADYAFRGKRVLSVSTASAIRDAAIDTPQPVPAREFVNSLLESVPVLGT